MWEPLSFDIKGPDLAEARETFTDYRLDIVFTHDSQTYRKPGYFAADGAAYDTGANSGNIWRVKFTPPRAGTWDYAVQFTQKGDASADDAAGWAAVEGFDNVAGRFDVLPAKLDSSAANFARRGMLLDVKGRYLKYGGASGDGTGELFLKTGAGSPENLLAYSEFDGTYDVGGTNFPALGDNQLHEFKPHVKDALAGDPTWQGGKGASILGVANYYETVGVNAQYIVTMNIEGDGQDVFPYVSHDDPYVFDVSKLEQWQRVLEHYNTRGVLIDMLLTETENESWFEAIDGLTVGEDFAPSRKLYYREMVARFGHLNGLVWNLGEENGVVGNSGKDPYRQPTTAQQRLVFGEFISKLDPYSRAILSHNWPDGEAETYGPKLGAAFWSGISSQSHTDYAKRIIEWTAKSKAAGRQWMVTIDEPLGWEFGARPDADAAQRKREIEGVLWPTLLAGGAGVDWYFGWQNNAPTSDLSNEDQRTRDELWRKSAQVGQFLTDNFQMQTLRADFDEATGTLAASLKTLDGDTVLLTLSRTRPALPEGEGHNPWEYDVSGLSLTYAGQNYDIDTLDPVFPALPKR